MNNIIMSHKNSFIYIEYCRISTVDNQLCFSKSNNGEIKYYTIPYGNLSILILGSGTSITQQAARLIASNKMLLAFSSGNMGNLYLTSQSEYRKPQFLQKWYQMWYNDKSRLNAAKYFFEKRFSNNLFFWKKLNGKIFSDDKIQLNILELENLNKTTLEKVKLVSSTSELLGIEGNYVKEIYHILSKDFNIGFKRDHKDGGGVNDFLNKANYLAYGISSAVLWTLGISASFPLFHGKTRNGGLVFDLADTIKDAITSPLSFIATYYKLSSKDLRKMILENFEDFNILSNLFYTIKETLLDFDNSLNDQFFEEDYYDNSDNQ